MTAILSVVFVGLATFAIFFYIAVIWWLDRYEREPIWMVGLAFLWGAIGGTCFGCLISAPISLLAVELFGPEIGSTFGTVVVAPVIEEITKALIFVPLFFSKHFDNETDGLIYGAATGLGFAALENIMYFATAEDFSTLITLVVLRTLFTAVVHCVSSSLIGVAVGFAKHRVGLLGAMAIIGLGYFLAVLNHAVWNGIATATGFIGSSAGAGIFAIGAIIVILAAITMFLLTQFSLMREHRALARILRDEAALGTIPLAHAEVLPFWLKRRGSNWLPAYVNKSEYIKTATLLAFRVHQSEVAKERVKASMLAEVVELRARVQALLAGPK